MISIFTNHQFYAACHNIAQQAYAKVHSNIASARQVFEDYGNPVIEVVTFGRIKPTYDDETYLANVVAFKKSVQDAPETPTKDALAPKREQAINVPVDMAQRSIAARRVYQKKIKAALIGVSIFTLSALAISYYKQAYIFPHAEL